MQHIANMPGGCPGCAERDGGAPDGPFLESGNESELYARLARTARALARFELFGDMAVRGALVLRLIYKSGGPTRRCAIEAALLAKGWSPRTVGGTLLELHRAGLVQRTKPGRYVLTPKAFAYREIDRLERLRRFDTGSESLPPGVMLEHARLDGMWQKLVRERDEARAEVERLIDALVDISRIDFRAGYADAYLEVIGIANKALAANK